MAMTETSLDEIIRQLVRVSHLFDKEPRQVLRDLNKVGEWLNSQIPFHDGHIQRVCRYSLAIGRELGLEARDIFILEASALLHDFGKICIDESIVEKPRALSAEERIEMEYHVLRGFYVLQGFAGFSEMLDGVKYHHERYDGSGYPERLRGLRIPLVARIIAIADAFDAMTSARPYRKARPRYEAIEEVKRCSGTQFDPALVKVFLRIAYSL